MTKKLIPLIIIAILLPAVLASCADAGEPLVDASLDVERCYLNAYDISENLLSSVIVRAAEADELYGYFSSSGYASLLGAVADFKPYISVTFEKATESGEYGGVVEFIVYSTDKVELNDEIIGRLDGAFAMLASCISEKFRDVEHASIANMHKFNADGKETDYAAPIGDLSRKIFYELDGGAYIKGDGSVNRLQDCINIVFLPQAEFDIESGDMYEFKVYGDDYVTRRNIYSKDGYTDLGYLKGSYKMLEEAFAHCDEIKAAETNAGFSFSRLILQTKLGTELELSDFPEVKCLRVGKLMDGEDSILWTLIIESESEKEIREAEKLLEARDDILLVSLDYFMSID